MREASSQTSLRRYGFASLVPFFEGTRYNTTGLSQVMTNMLHAWDFFKDQLSLPTLSQEELWRLIFGGINKSPFLEHRCH